MISPTQIGRYIIYGVISIHNLQIADAVGQRGNIRFVP
ncbi:hypothetical protein, partial [Enterobacter hormaechei]